MTGSLRIGGALLLGILIILVAFLMQKDSYAESVGTGSIVQVAPERSAIETQDTDGDGTPDWEEDLEEIFVDSAVLASSSLLAKAGEPYESPTTFTGKFSEAFFKDYLEGKINGQDYTDPTAFVGNAVQAIEKNTQSKRYTRLDIQIVPTTDADLHIYGNRVAEINQIHSIGNENEALILQRALEAKDPKKLEALEPIRVVYESMIADLLLMQVPDVLAEKHIALLNAYEAILTDVKAMQSAFVDPLYALARVKTYKDDAMALFVAFQDINILFSEKGVVFLSDEPGTFFYLFDS